jgi:hypothetical protein
MRSDPKIDFKVPPERNKIMKVLGVGSLWRDSKEPQGEFQVLSKRWKKVV